MCRLPGGLDLSGLIYFIMNIPLFYLGYRVLGRQFAVKTLITVAIQSIFLMIIPIPATPVIDDYLTSCIIGASLPEQEPDLSLEEEVQAEDRTLSDFAVQKVSGLQCGAY